MRASNQAPVSLRTLERDQRDWQCTPAYVRTGRAGRLEPALEEAIHPETSLSTSLSARLLTPLS